MRNSMTTRRNGAVLSVARKTSRMRVAVSPVRTRTAYHRARTRMTALGSPSKHENLQNIAASNLSIFGQTFYLHN